MNLNWKEIQGGKFYSGWLGALLWLSTIRNIQGFNMIPECSTAELLDASHLIVESLTSIKG